MPKKTPTAAPCAPMSNRTRKAKADPEKIQRWNRELQSKISSLFVRHHDEEYLRRELQTLQKVFEAGNEAGLYDAIVLCGENSAPLPQWALEAVLDRQRELIRGENNRRAAWQRRYRQDMIDYVRAEMVQEERELGTPWKLVYEKVSNLLRGTGCEGGKDTIEGSYKRFVRTFKVDPSRYYVSRWIYLKEYVGVPSRVFLPGRPPQPLG